MPGPNPLEPPTTPVGIAVNLVLEVDVGVTTIAALKAWRPGDVLRLPGFDGLRLRLRAGRHVAAEGELVAPALESIELRLTRVP